MKTVPPMYTLLMNTIYLSQSTHVAEMKEPFSGNKQCNNNKIQ